MLPPTYRYRYRYLLFSESAFKHFKNSDFIGNFFICNEINYTITTVNYRYNIFTSTVPVSVIHNKNS